MKFTIDIVPIEETVIGVVGRLDLTTKVPLYHSLFIQDAQESVVQAMPFLEPENIPEVGYWVWDDSEEIEWDDEEIIEQ